MKTKIVLCLRFQDLAAAMSLYWDEESVSRKSLLQMAGRARLPFGTLG